MRLLINLKKHLPTTVGFTKSLVMPDSSGYGDYRDGPFTWTITPSTPAYKELHLSPAEKDIILKTNARLGYSFSNGEPFHHLYVDGIERFGRILVTGRGTLFVYRPATNEVYFEGSRDAFKQFASTPLLEGLKAGNYSYKYLETGAPTDMSPWETRPEYLSRKYNINIELVGLIQRRVERDTSSDSSELSSSLLEKIVRLYSEEGFYLSKDQLQLYVEYMKAQQGLIQGGEAAAVRKQWFDLAPNKGIEGV